MYVKYTHTTGSIGHLSNEQFIAHSKITSGVICRELCSPVKVKRLQKFNTSSSADQDRQIPITMTTGHGANIDHAQLTTKHSKHSTKNIHIWMIKYNHGAMRLRNRENIDSGI